MPVELPFVLLDGGRGWRIRRVRQHLVLSEASIDQIAADAGFANRFHMNRVFKKLAGCGPATFRRRHVQV
jgi:transcriptional regulator GlxA family with amidase domain